MTDADEDELAPPTPRPRFRWVRRLVLWPAGAVAVVALVLLVGRWQVGRLGQRELNGTLQRLDAEEPDWRLDAVMAQRARRPEPPANENANVRILKLADQIPNEWNEWANKLWATDWQREHPNNRRPGREGLAQAEEMIEPTRELRARALELRNARPGAYPITVAQDPIATLLPHLDRARRVVGVLQYAAAWETLHGNPNRGIAAARAGLVVARSIGDEPMLISQLVRIACAKMAANMALQTLAWGEPTEGLAELQAELLAEADVPWFRYGMHGERAMLDRVFEGIENNTIPWKNLFTYAQVGDPGPQHYAAFRAYQALLPGDRAKCLQLCTELVTASRLPHHEQLAAVKNVAYQIPKGPPDEFRYIGTRLLLPACERVAESGLRARADLLAATTAIACERFRRKHDKFPKALNELVPEFLPAVPLNPFDAQPLTYRVYPDRITISCVCIGMSQAISNPPEEFREGNRPDRSRITGYRLWAVEQRGLPPEEKPEENPQP